MKRLCTICARGGSKGVPNKNIRVVAGRPLIAYTVAQAVETGLFDAIAVSSDSDEILEAARVAGAGLLVKRPDELATDFADKSPAMAHCGRVAEELTGLRFDTFVDLDATAPLRAAGHIAGVVALLESTDATNVYTVTPSRRSPYYNMVELDVNNVPRLVKDLDPPVVRRQDAPPTYDMNASIYAWRRDAFLDAGAPVHMDGTRVFMMPEWSLFDVDSELDFDIVSLLLEKMLGKASA